jgi:hypothetical protein
MAIYFTIAKNPAESLTVIFDSDGLQRARGYKQGLLRETKAKYQITISGIDSDGNRINE